MENVVGVISRLRWALALLLSLIILVFSITGCVSPSVTPSDMSVDKVILGRVIAIESFESYSVSVIHFEGDINIIVSSSSLSRFNYNFSSLSTYRFHEVRIISLGVEYDIVSAQWVGGYTINE